MKSHADLKYHSTLHSPCCLHFLRACLCTATRLWQSSSGTALQHVVRRAPEARALPRLAQQRRPYPPAAPLFGALQGIRRSTKGRTTGGGVDFASLISQVWRKKGLDSYCRLNKNVE